MGSRVQPFPKGVGPEAREGGQIWREGEQEEGRVGRAPACGLKAAAPGLWAAGRWLGHLAKLPRGIRDLPGPGIKPVSPALADRFFTTEPPGKPAFCCF